MRVSGTSWTSDLFQATRKAETGKLSSGTTEANAAEETASSKKGKLSPVEDRSKSVPPLGVAQKHGEDRVQNQQQAHSLLQTSLSLNATLNASDVNNMDRGNAPASGASGRPDRTPNDNARGLTVFGMESLEPGRASLRYDAKSQSFIMKDGETTESVKATPGGKVEFSNGVSIEVGRKFDPNTSDMPNLSSGPSVSFLA